MTHFGSGDTVAILEQFQTRLDAHFRELGEARAEFNPTAPIFALEHGLTEAELHELKVSVRDAVKRGFGSHYWKRAWLPFVVYAAESGYNYTGEEFWQSFEKETPRWAQHGKRDRLQEWFCKFHSDYGGAEPEGKFAEKFKIIAWPITHAILPLDLQRQLARLLFEFRTRLTGELLQNPRELGKQLASTARHDNGRFSIFCKNTDLLGQVSAALLSGEDEDTPYLEQAMLRRLVDSLKKEREAGRWLSGAREAANRARTKGFKPSFGENPIAQSRERSPESTNPRLSLQKRENGWQLFAQLPDLAVPSLQSPELCEDLRTKRARVEGAKQEVIARGRLATTRQEIQLRHLPRPGKAFIELENATPVSNILLREKVKVNSGPFWLFKSRFPNLAIEINEPLVRPGVTYMVVHNGSWCPPSLNWVTPDSADIEGAEIVRLEIPDHVTEQENAALVDAGLSVVTNVLVRPVGFAASSWDGNGTVEWTEGEPGLIGIRVERTPVECVLTLNGACQIVPWPHEERELFVGLDGFPVGAHELHVSLSYPDETMPVEGLLEVVVRDSKTRSEMAEAGEGIRLFASPAHPKLCELWEDDAVTVVGPEGLAVDLRIMLRTKRHGNQELDPRTVVLPLLEHDWVRVAKQVRQDRTFRKHINDAYELELSVSRKGVGYAKLAAKREFEPLRWQVVQERERRYAYLINSSDSTPVHVELYHVKSPLSPEVCTTGTDVKIPRDGGLLRAVAGDNFSVETAIILPTSPKDMVGKQQPYPVVPTGARAPKEVMRLVVGYKRWEEAELRGDMFAQVQRNRVLRAIASALAALIGGSRWAKLERYMSQTDDLESYLKEMRSAVGETGEQKRLALAIDRKLSDWASHSELSEGFMDAAGSAMKAAGFTNLHNAQRFLLTLAECPGDVSHWDPEEREVLLERTLDSPVLLRAARFAVLGTRALMNIAEVSRGS